MSGALYIWIFGALFLGLIFLLGVFAALFWVGHRIERKETGAKHGFLELPEGSGSRPARRSGEMDAEGK